MHLRPHRPAPPTDRRMSERGATPGAGSVVRRDKVGTAASGRASARGAGPAPGPSRRPWRGSSLGLGPRHAPTLRRAVPPTTGGTARRMHRYADPAPACLRHAVHAPGPTSALEPPTAPNPAQPPQCSTIRGPMRKRGLVSGESRRYESDSPGRGARDRCGRALIPDRAPSHRGAGRPSCGTAVVSVGAPPGQSRWGAPRRRGIVPGALRSASRSDGGSRAHASCAGAAAIPGQRSASARELAVPGAKSRHSGALRPPRAHPPRRGTAGRRAGGAPAGATAPLPESRPARPAARPCLPATPAGGDPRPLRSGAGSVRRGGGGTRPRLALIRSVVPRSERRSARARGPASTLRRRNGPGMACRFHGAICPEWPAICAVHGAGIARASPGCGGRRVQPLSARRVQAPRASSAQ